jgi:hypothetical protein
MKAQTGDERGILVHLPGGISEHRQNIIVVIKFFARRHEVNEYPTQLFFGTAISLNQ